MNKGPIGKILQPSMEQTESPDSVASEKATDRLSSEDLVAHLNGLEDRPWAEITEQLPLPTLDERARLFLRAVHGERDFTDHEHTAARNRLLDEMANQIAPTSGDRLGDGRGTGTTFNLRWPTFHGWQWSGLVAIAAALAVIAVFGFQFWQQQVPPGQSFQIAMVTLEDRSVLTEGVRRTRGPQDLSPQSSSRQESLQYRFSSINIPTDLLRRAIASASNNRGAVEHSELMNFLHVQNDAYNNQARILIDSVLADSLSKKLDQPDNTEVRVYDLDDSLTGNIRSKIKPPPEDAHSLFLTVRR